MKTIGIVLKKELKRFFTDPRMILGLILPGILIAVLYSFMGDFMTKNLTNTETNYTVCIENMPEEFSAFNEIEGWTVELKTYDREEAIAEVKNKNLDIYICYEENFYTNMLAYTANPQVAAPKVEIYYNSTSTTSDVLYEYYVSILNGYESAISNKFDINPGSTPYDLAEDDDISMQIFTMMLPFLLMIFLFTGCMGICTESIAGEKERGTIATLLITPAKRHEIAIGKLLALSITSIVSAVASLLGLVVSLPKMMSGANVSLAVYGFTTYLSLFAIIIVTVFLFVIILTAISTISKSVKEANSYAVVVNVLVMILGVTSFMGTTAASSAGLYFIPVYNSIQSMIAILSGSINGVNLAITIVSNLCYTALGVYGITKLFNNEKIMFNK